MEFYTISTDSWETLGNQTNAVPALGTQRIAVNDWIKGVPSGVSGIFDVGGVPFESSTDSGLWKVSGTADKYTGDGLHAVQFGYVAIQSSGVIPEGAFQ